MAESEQEQKTDADKKREDLRARVLEVNNLVQYQEGTVASRMIVFKTTGTVTLFAFDAGEGLSEHSAPYDAILTVTDGEADVMIAGSPFTVRTGEMIILPANKPHAVQARQRFKMSLVMIKE
ncbi:MAG: cupin domain-containing protein [Methanoregula sp.]|jgi:quercetin dioxygenase-like cupin family protein|uniref:cupin domain-containing protein n=1 Tax=Methanoregula sp. TaxID=2052170 RepID=UPI003D0E5AFB